MNISRLVRVGISAACACALLVPLRADATGVPIGGFLPIVGLSLTNKFKNQNSDTFLFADPEPNYAGTPLGPGTSAHYDLALYDTGAAVSILTAASDAAFNVASEGFRGTHTITLGGATGFVDGTINDPLAMFATGLGGGAVMGGSPLTLSTANMKGLSSASIVTLPPTSDLPNVVGLPFSSQYATYIRNDQPQIVTINGRTVRTPQLEFLPLGSGAQGTMSRAPITLSPGEAFSLPPFYFPDFLSDPFTNDPVQPTNVSGGLYLNINLQHTTPRSGTQSLSSQFLFDTGADVTVMSEFNASLLGFDVLLDEPDFTVDVVGSGGVKVGVPGFIADQLTLPAIGGSLSLQNVPIIVLDLPDLSNPVNVIPGIIGTNLFAGRNVVIDPVTAIGGGSPSVYFSAPMTTQKNWTTAAASGTFGTGSNWSGSSAPDIRGIANVRHVSGGNQTAVVAASTKVWELNVSGTASQTMTVQINDGVTLTTFSGVNIEPGGVVTLAGGTLDAQFVEVVGGTLRGTGLVTTGSGSIDGQVENRSGTVAPGNGVGTLEIEGRFAVSKDGTVAIEVGGYNPGTGFDRLEVDGAVVLSGTLSVARVDLGGGLFTPQIGDRFKFLTSTDGISGEFDRLYAPGIVNWAVAYGADASGEFVELIVNIPGDYNDDGRVDGGDYVKWRNALGTSDNLDADGNGNTMIDVGDYAVWKEHYGQTLDLGSGGLSTPEPAAGALALLGLVVVGLTRRRTARCRSGRCTGARTTGPVPFATWTSCG